MHLEALQVRQVRNLSDVTLTPGPGLNILFGENASGKTAFLEAIYLLSYGRSFRTPRIRDVVQYQHKTLLVSAKLCSDKHGSIHTGIEKGQGTMSIRYNGAVVKSISDQVRHFPVVLVTPDSHLLVTASPRDRRHWLDWALFHVEPGYLGLWKDYFKALKHRNTLLRDGVNKVETYRGWERMMVEFGLRISWLREGFLSGLVSTLNTLSAGLFDEEFTLQLVQGWPGQQEFAGCLEGGRSGDQVAGFTRYGPHRADIRFILKNKELKVFFSRGQIKMFISLLVLAQACEIRKATGISPVVLLDDYTAEMGHDYSKHLLTVLKNVGFQVFATTTEQPDEPGPTQNHCTFHVEQGYPTRVT